MKNDKKLAMLSTLNPSDKLIQLSKKIVDNREQYIQFIKNVETIKEFPLHQLRTSIEIVEPTPVKESIAKINFAGVMIELLFLSMKRNKILATHKTVEIASIQLINRIIKQDVSSFDMIIDYLKSIKSYKPKKGYGIIQ